MIKATRIVRKVDDLGRVVLPKELRRTLEIDEYCPMEIYTEGDKIILKKYEPACTFCGSTEQTLEYKGKVVCGTCAREIGQTAKA